MSRNTGKVALSVLAVIIFFGFMYLILDGVLDMVALASIPVVLCAEGIVLGMFYATLFHSESEEMAAAAEVAAKTETTKLVPAQNIQRAILPSRAHMVKS